MGERKKSPKGLRVLLPLGVGALALVAVTRGPVAEVSEIDAFQRAISSQTKADALAFIKGFGSSHLVPDLIDLLQPDVALEVCASLSGSSSRTRTACDKVRAAATIEPAAGPGTPPISVVVAPASPPSTASIPTPSATTPAPAVVSTAPSSSAPVTETPKAPMAELPAPPSKTPPPTPAFTVAPAPEPSAAPATAEQVAIVPLVQQDSVATTERKTSSANAMADIWRKLTARFDQRPFQVNYSDRTRGEMVVTYSGNLSRFVACGHAIGVANASLETGGVAGNQLNSRMLIHLANGNSGSPSLSIDAIHIVALSQPTSRSPDVVNVRLDKPARTSDGRYCWSTGEMERLARAQ